MDSLFGDTRSSSPWPRPPPASPARNPPRRPRPVPLANLDDWLDFAEALLGRQDIAPDSLASDFSTLSQMEDTKTSWNPPST